MERDAVVAGNWNVRAPEARSVTDVPDTEHFAILFYEQSSIWVPGDERSRTNPGHGYPEHTEDTSRMRYYVFTDEKKYTDALRTLHEEKPGRKDIKGIHVAGVARARMRIEVDP
jgi:hypothetical protein